MRGVNYYPAKNPWEKMWLEWDAVVIEKDLKLVKELNLNLVETYIHYPFFFSEEEDEIKIDLIQRLDEFLSIANQYHLKVIYTLFDFTYNHSLRKWPFHKKYLTEIVKRFRDDERIYLWGIRNEINFIKEPIDTLIQWAESVATLIRRYDTLHPLEVELGGRDLNTLKNAAQFIERLKERVDIFALSFFGEPESLPTILFWLREKTGKPVVVSEFGYPTSWAKGEEGQKNYFKRMLKVLKKNQTGFRFWTLCEFAKENLSPEEKTLGIIRLGRQPKKTYSLLKKISWD